MNRPPRDRRWQSPKDRARVAAELIEEAESLSETGLIATPAELAHATRPPPIHVPAESPARDADPVPKPERPAGVEPAVCVAARAARTEHDRDVALAGLDRALREAPDDPTLLVGRATLHATAGNYGAARRDLDSVLRANPNHAEALTALGLVLSRRGLWADAAVQLQRAVTADPSRAIAWYYLGEALNHLDDLSGALGAFTRAAELEPANGKAYHGQGIVLDRLNRPADATQMYRRARDVSRR